MNTKIVEMKISWGYKILFAYIAFVAGIMFLVYKANQEKFDLVTDNYYDAELKYQDVINQKQRAAELSSLPVISHSTNSVNIQLPQEFLNQNLTGELYLYRPSDATKDIRKEFSTQSASVRISLDKDLSGLYEVKLSWKAAGKTFYNEQRIFF